MLSTQFIALTLGLFLLFSLRHQYQKSVQQRHLQIQKEVLEALEPLKGIQYDEAFWEAVKQASVEKGLTPSAEVMDDIKLSFKNSSLFNESNMQRHLEVLRPTKLKGPFIALTWLIPGIIIELIHLPWAWYLLFGLLTITLMVVYKKIIVVKQIGEKVHILPRIMYNLAMASKISICSNMLLLLSLHAALTILKNTQATTEQKDKALSKIVLDFQAMFKKAEELNPETPTSLHYFPQYSDAVTVVFNYYVKAFKQCMKDPTANVNPTTLS